MKNTLVLINDVSESLENLRTYLDKEEDIDLVILSTLEELDTFNEHRVIHVLLINSQCKNINPFDVFKKIRSCDVTKFLPIIYINKKDDKSDIRKAYEAGVNECVNAPFGVEDITLRIRSHMLNYQAFKRCLIQNERLFTIVSTDSLTKVSSRMHLQTIILQSIKEYQRYDRLFSIIAIQSEDIQKYNLIYGFTKGDQLLKDIAQAIKVIIRDSDIIARWSGGEFIIFMPKSNIENAGTLVKKINKQILSKEFLKSFNVRLKYGATQVKKDDTIQTITNRVNKALQSSIENNAVYTPFL